jgi:hypothetical protein
MQRQSNIIATVFTQSKLSRIFFNSEKRTQKMHCLSSAVPVSYFCSDVNGSITTVAAVLSPLNTILSNPRTRIRIQTPRHNYRRHRLVESNIVTK